MADSMSKKERLARGSAVIKVMRVIPRPGHFLKWYMEAHKLPKKAKPPGWDKNPAVEAPHLDVKNASFQFLPNSARIGVQLDINTSEDSGGPKDPCAAGDGADSGPLLDDQPTKLGLPDGDKLLNWFGYRTWARDVNPVYDGNIAEHFNVLLGLLITMAEDPENENFPDAEAYPCVQFLRSIKTPDGDVPYNTANFIAYLEYVASKMLEDI